MRASTTATATVGAYRVSMVRESDTPYTALTVHAPEDVYPIVRSMIPEWD
jgi:hypothetical protein